MDKTRYFERLDLITQIQEEGKKLLSGGHNYIFTMESNVDEVTGRDTTMYAIASAIQKEAKKITAMGYNAKISCEGGDVSARQAEERRLWKQKIKRS